METRDKRIWCSSGFIAAGLMAVLMTAAAVNAVTSDENPAGKGDSAPNTAHLRETFTRDLELPAQASINIRNESGRISVTGWDGDTVSISVVKRMDVLGGSLESLKARFGMPLEITEEEAAFFNALDLDVRTNDGALEIGITRPAFAPGLSFSFHMDVKVPRKTDLNVRTENGPVAIRGIQGQVHAETANGQLTCEDITGSLNARSRNGGIVCRAIEGGLLARASNGSIEVDGRDATAAYAIYCETDNGAIKLNLPKNSSFYLAAMTSNGYVKTRLEVDGEVPRGAVRSVSGPVGAGGPVVHLRTLNGSIYLGES